MLYISMGGAEQVQWTERLGWDLKWPALTAQIKALCWKGLGLTYRTELQKLCNCSSLKDSSLSMLQTSCIELLYKWLDAFMQKNNRD